LGFLGVLVGGPRSPIEEGDQWRAFCALWVNLSASCDGFCGLS
jgi:hypothetical protein